MLHCFWENLMRLFLLQSWQKQIYYYFLSTTISQLEYQWYISNNLKGRRLWFRNSIKVINKKKYILVSVNLKTLCDAVAYLVAFYYDTHRYICKFVVLINLSKIWLPDKLFFVWNNANHTIKHSTALAL